MPLEIITYDPSIIHETTQVFIVLNRKKKKKGTKV